MAGFTILADNALLGAEMASSGPVALEVEAGRIAEIRPAAAGQPRGEVIDLSRHLLVPGTINGHFHSHEHFHKGRYDNLPLELWMNYVRPPRPMPLTARQVYLRTMIGAIEAMRSGTTTICDDMNVLPVLNREHVEAAFQAYEDIGLRAHVGITLFDKPFFRGMPFVEEEMPPELIAELTGAEGTTPDELLAYARGLARDRHPAERRVGYIAAPSAPQRCTHEFLLAVRRMADEHDLPLMMHVQETRTQVVTGQVLFGCPMVEHLDRIGFLKPKTVLIHGIWLNPREVEILARTGASVQHNPTCNMKMGSGIAPVRELIEAGVNVSLGTDGCGSVETVDMHKTMRNAALLNKVRTPDHSRWFGAEEAFRFATVGGACALGRIDLGCIEVGRRADLAAYRLDSIAYRPLNNPLRQLVYSETGANLSFVMVDGEVAMRDGRLTRIDEARLLDEVAEAHSDLLHDIETAEQSAARLIPAYRRILARCRATEIAPDTYPALVKSE